MLIVSIRRSRNGHRLYIVDTPLWALVAEEIAQAFCGRFGHPFCQGRLPFGFRLGQRLLSPASRRERPRWSASLTDAEVRATFPESYVDIDLPG